MQFQSLTPASTIPGGAIRATMSEAASAMIETLKPFDFAIEDALDRAYGKGQWFLSWDEDLAGHPIRGTMTINYGGETLVVG